MIVSVEDGSIVSLERIEVDVLRWASIEIDCTDASAGEASNLMREALSSTWRGSDARMPLIVRITLAGATTDAGGFIDRSASLRDDARAIAAAISPDLFIEKVRTRVTAPLKSEGVPLGDDLALLIAEAGSDPDLAAAIAEDLEPFLVAARTSLREPEQPDLRAKANDGDWPGLLETAALALGSRLTRKN